MPILFQKRRNLKEGKRSKENAFETEKECKSRDKHPEICQSSKNGNMDVNDTNRDEAKKSRKAKTLRKIKSVLKKGKQKFCKERKRVSKICIHKLEGFDRTFMVLKEFTSTPCGNQNQSALGDNLSPPSSPRLRSNSCTMMSEVTSNDVTVACPVNRLFPELVDYSKYVPVRKIWGPLFPRSLVEDFKMVWLDMQLWYSRFCDLKEKRKTNDDLSPSKSDTSLTESPSKIKPLLDAKSTQGGGRVCRNARDERQRLIHLRHRFHLEANREYIAMVSWQQFYTPLECRLKLIVSLSDRLIHLKTTMLVTCLRSFVQDDGDFEVMWEADIKAVLPSKFDLKTCPSLSPEVAMELASQLTRVKAVLYVTRAASILLRHQGTAFLDTVAVTVGIERAELMILPYHLHPKELNDVPFCGKPDKDEELEEEKPDPLF